MTSCKSDCCKDGDKLSEECGLFGIYGQQDAAAITALGLHALQHRGQEASGIVSFDKRAFHSELRPGLISENFTKPNVMAKLPGDQAMGHVRYSTSGGSAFQNIQPLFAELDVGGIAIAHNGNFTNAITVRHKLIEQGAIFRSKSDTENFLHLISRSRKYNLIDRFVDAYRQTEGGFSLLAMTDDYLIGARDPLGIRPLLLGDLNGAPVFASETCAFDIIGAKFVRNVDNGEMVICGKDGIKSLRIAPKVPERMCIFEYIYFSRPDSIINGKDVYSVRQEMGRQLAREKSLDADMVVPVPDSAVPAALGFARQAGLPFEFGIIRNHYVGRTFIEPVQSIRAFGVKLKHNANANIVNGKRIVLVDDSIVRGTTSTKIVEMMREAGAAEVHMRISSPPIIYPDYYGIDTPKNAELMAANHSVDEICQLIGCDSLEFLSLDGLYTAVCGQNRNSELPQFADHYFTGDYPTTLSDLKIKNYDQVKTKAVEPLVINAW